MDNAEVADFGLLITVFVNNTNEKHSCSFR